MKTTILILTIILLSSIVYGSFRIKQVEEEKVTTEIKQIKTSDINNSYQIALMRRRESGNNKMLWGAILSAGYGLMAFPAANNQEAEGKDGDGARVLGVGFLLFSGYLFYRYSENNYYGTIIPSNNKITFMLSKKF